MKSSTTILLSLATVLTTSRIEAFTPVSPLAAPRSTATGTPGSETALSFITEKDDLGTTMVEPQKVVVAPGTDGSTTTRITTTRRKPSIEAVSSFSQLQYFLEDDERPVAIKFYAPWCKTCQRLGMHFDRLAMELGDAIVDRQIVEGPIRFATIEYGSETARLVTETLKIPAVPTLQVYKGTHKIWEEHGAKTTKGLKATLNLLRSMTPDELEAHAEEVDDHILTQAVEESFFDSPDFLNEEW